jgi:FkbM family methyltransferase
VWAFEPSTESYRCAQITTMLNGLTNVVLTHAALDAKGGKALLATSTGDGVPRGGASHVIKDPAQASRWGKEEIDLVALDEMVGDDRNVALIQLDVEGHEQIALAGALRTIARCRPVIVLEDLPKQDWLEQNLTPLGYSLAGSVNANVILRSR